MRSACSGLARQLSRQRIRLKSEQVDSPLDFAVNFATPVWLNASLHVGALERCVCRATLNISTVRKEEGKKGLGCVDRCPDQYVSLFLSSCAFDFEMRSKDMLDVLL